MASIRKRGPYQYQAEVRRKGYPPQRRTFETKAGAEVWARDTETQMDKGTWEDRTEAEQTTLEEALERYLREVTPTKKSAEQETYRIRQLQRGELAQRPLARVRGVDIAGFRDARLKDVAPSTVRLDLALLSNLFTIARREWSIAGIGNPVSDVRFPSPHKGRDRRLVPGEEERILRAAERSDKPWIKPLIQLALETAMRRGELLSLTWSRLDLENRVAHLPETKNGEARSVPLSEKATQILRSLPRSLDNRVIPLSANAARIAWSRTLERANREGKKEELTPIEDLRFHDLRHEATSRFFERTDLGMMEIATITGHKDLRMLKRYTHLRAGDLAQKLG